MTVGGGSDGSGWQGGAELEGEGRRRQQGGSRQRQRDVGAADSFSDSGEGEREGWVGGGWCREREGQSPHVAVGGLFRAEPRGRSGRGQVMGAAAGSSRGRQTTTGTRLGRQTK